MEAVMLDWDRIAEHLLRVFLAFVFALPIGWERKHGRNSIGLRTFPIVSMAACGFALIAVSMPSATVESNARVLQGIVSGIGFIGGGAILKQGANVRGLATAASIWNTGAIGVAVAYRREEIALVLSGINFLALLWLRPVAEIVDERLDDE